MGSLGERLPAIVWLPGWVENKNRWNLKTACLHLEHTHAKKSIFAVYKGH